ncbi:MAG: 30S ribosomal protein S12 methylthiotransferase accessory factor YcaO [Pseudomonadota bacterium]
MPHTLIPGKERALEDTIAELHRLVRDLGFHIEEARWLNPAPHIWSVHIRDRDCPRVFANGKGGCREAALASAYGELVERLATRYLWADFMLDPMLETFGFIHHPDERWFPVEDGTWPEGLLDADWYRRYIDGTDLVPGELRDLNGGGTGRGLCALPYVRQSDGETVWVPVNLIANLFVSNGMSAGNTRDEALVQGLAEIFERAIKNRIIVHGTTLPRVPDAVLDRHPAIREGLAALTDHGFAVRPLDASLGGRYPVMCVLLQHPDGGVYASFGAHPDFGVALERALTELLQGRALDELAGFPPPTTEAEMVADPHNIELHFIDSSGYVHWALLAETPDHPFHDWERESPWPTDNSAARAALIDALHAEGHEVYIAEHTDLGAYTCRILVPGFSDIYEADELIWDNNNSVLPVRPVLFDLHGSGAEGWRDLYETLEEHQLNEQLRVFEWAGVVGDPDTAWNRLRIGELKVWLLLALGDEEEAAARLPSVLASGNLDDDERRALSALNAVLELRVAGLTVDDHRPALAAWFGAEPVAAAERRARGEERFPRLGPLDPAAPSRSHTTLLEACAKVLRRQNGGGVALPGGAV